MQRQRILVVFTVINFALAMFSVIRPRAVVTKGVTSVIRGRALEIVDDQGRVRASIAVYKADPKVRMPDGTNGYPESVLFRLITSQGRPNVKIAATERGSATVFGGEADPTYVQILAEGGNTSLKLTNKDQRQQIIKP
jgi:hypothetical protein